MKTLLISLGLGALATAAAAQGRPSTLAMTCGQTRALIAQQGAIVLSTGLHTYDRYVRDQGFCPLGEITQPVWERTADAAQCPIGYRCRSFGENRDIEGR
jgi:hypothetical protein